MGPAIPAKCKACGQKITVTLASVVVVVPIGVLLMLVQYVPSLNMKALILVLGFGLILLAYWKFVRLIKA